MKTYKSPNWQLKINCEFPLFMVFKYSLPKMLVESLVRVVDFEKWHAQSSLLSNQLTPSDEPLPLEFLWRILTDWGILLWNVEHFLEKPGKSFNKTSTYCSKILIISILTHSKTILSRPRILVQHSSIIVIIANKFFLAQER